MITHSEMVTGLVKSGQTIKEEITAEDAALIHMIMGISGEVGELMDAVKKNVMYRKPLDMENVIEELGDIEFYLEGFRQALGVKREDTLAANIGKLGVRYKGFSYSDQAAQDRADKQIDGTT